MQTYDTLVVGGGQAGLAMSHCLTVLGREHVVLERARVAERWRTQRWDSLMFQFPNWSLELPGLAYRAADPHAFATRDEVLGFIEAYASTIAAPLRSGVHVTALRASSTVGRYVLDSSAGRFAADNVVIATGPYQVPRLPAWHRDLPATIVQVHASEYRHPGALPAGAVLVVGSGASGCQIAHELLAAGRRVYLAIGRHRRVPRRYRGHDVFWWRREIGELDQTVEMRRAPLPAPLVTGVRGGYDIDLRRFAAEGMTLLGHLQGANDGQLRFAPDVQQSLQAGDATLREFTATVDAFVQRSGLQVPAAETRAEYGAPIDSPEQLDLRAAGITSVVWATGYRFDFGWVELPLFDAHGVPLHRRGVSAVPGLYFLGLPWLHKAKSSFLYGVGEDAAFIAACIAGDKA